MTWIRVDQSLRTHPKLRKAAKLLTCGELQMIGHLTCLWWWAVDYAPDGDLSRYSAEDIELAANWTGEPGALFRALFDCRIGDGEGFLERDAEGRTKIHDWGDYAGKLIERRARNAARMRATRARDVSDTCDAQEEHVRGYERTDVRTKDERTNERTDEGGSGETSPPPDITPLERAALAHLRQVKGYPFDYGKDLELLRLLAVQFPTVDLIEAARKWQVYKLDRPLEGKSNPRSQFRTWVRKEQEFAEKRGGRNGRKDRPAEGRDKDWFGRYAQDRPEEPGDLP